MVLPISCKNDYALIVDEGLTMYSSYDIVSISCTNILYLKVVGEFAAHFFVRSRSRVVKSDTSRKIVYAHCLKRYSLVPWYFSLFVGCFEKRVSYIHWDLLKGLFS